MRAKRHVISWEGKMVPGLHNPRAMTSYSLRRSRISAIEELSPRREGPLHVGWQRLRAAMRGGGVCPDLVCRSFHARLGPRARLCPTPEGVFELLDTYFHGDARGRLGEGRWLSHVDGERACARQIVARLRRQVPELGMLTLSDESTGAGRQLMLRMVGGCVAVPLEEVEVEELHVGQTRYVRRTVTVDGLVQATNQLLAMRGASFRFLPVDAGEDVDAYMAAEPAAAKVLDRVGFWAEPLEELHAFAGWVAPVAEQAVA